MRDFFLFILLAPTLLALEPGTPLVCLIHDPAPPLEFYANATGGGRALFGDTREMRFTQPHADAWRISVVAVRERWAYGGFTNALTRAVEDQVMVSPSALWHPLILEKYQPRLKALRLRVQAAGSPAGRSDLRLRVELKGFEKSGAQALRQGFEVERARLLEGAFPKELTFAVDAQAAPAGLVLVMLDRAVAGDWIEIGAMNAEVLPPPAGLPQRGALLGLGALLANWDEDTGMVQDRGSFPAGIYENLTATAKLAKLLALALHDGLVEREAAMTAVEKITSTLLDTAPRGPEPANRLWPHFTRNGGAARHPGSEWASGDTAYAAADLALALALTGDRRGRLPEVLGFLREVDWRALFHEGFYRHGYDKDGRLIPHRWEGFGTETLGMNLAALAGGGPLARMRPPPTDDGSGFNMHAAYPLPFEEVDRHGNDWRKLRLEEIRAQTSWYSRPENANPFLAGAGLYGLSAAETPDGHNYMAYGIGGRLDGARDGGRSMVTPHYCGMTAPLAPEDSARMLESLEARGWITPLNLPDSAAVNPETGSATVNWMKGSWNLALFTEGWLFASPAAARAAREALHSIPEFAHAWKVLFPPPAPQSEN